MTVALLLITIAAAILLALASSVQLMYLESLRLRTRDLPSLEHFKNTIEEKIGLDTDQGALSFSLIKHATLALLGVLVLADFGSRSLTWAIFLEACFISLMLMLIAGYVVPQLFYRRSSGRWMGPLAPLLRALALGTRPATAVLTFFFSLVEIADEHKGAEEPATPAENIEALISAGTEEGLIEEQDRKLIQSVVEFGDKVVREVMTPRPNIVAITAEATLEELRQVVINEQYSRIPIYEGSIDQIIGFVHVRDMFELSEEDRKQRKVAELVRPIRYVPETKPVNDLLREMQQDGAHMVIVIDEYGNTAGLATMEDLVEEILGEIRDEHEPERDVQEEPEGRYVVAGSVDVDRLRDLLGFRPQDETESTTVGGLVTEWLGRVPPVGEVIEREGLRIEVLDGNDLRVNQVRLSKAEQKTPV